MTKEKILIVDDETDLVETLVILLEANNYEVLCAYDGEEALDKTYGTNPGLIILDLALPKLDGYEVCRTIKSNDKYKNIPIIILTARSNDKNAERCKDAGANEYITKPFEPESIVATVKKLLDKPRP